MSVVLTEIMLCLCYVPYLQAMILPTFLLHRQGGEILLVVIWFSKEFLNGKGLIVMMMMEEEEKEEAGKG